MADNRFKDPSQKLDVRIGKYDQLASLKEKYPKDLSI